MLKSKEKSNATVGRVVLFRVGMIYVLEWFQWLFWLILLSRQYLKVRFVFISLIFVWFPSVLLALKLVLALK